MMVLELHLESEPIEDLWCEFCLRFEGVCGRMLLTDGLRLVQTYDVAYCRHCGVDLAFEATDIHRLRGGR